MRNFTSTRLALATFGLMTVVCHAHNLDTTATSISFGQDFIQTMSQRAALQQPLVRTNDEFWVLLKTTPGPGTNTGVGGYQTFYVPQGTRIMDTAYVFPDSSDPRGFRNIPMKGQSPIAIGNGSIGPATTTEFIGWQLPGVNGLGVKYDPVTATGADRGTLVGVYADTGIFYSTDLRTKFNSYGTLAPPLTGPPAPMKNNSGDSVGEYYAANILNSVPRNILGVMTLWDSYQLRAYGRSDVAPLMDDNGRGNAPWGLGNVVAGPQSGYAWEFDYAAYDATTGTSTDKLRAAIKIGPWNRIKYPGSQISSDQPGLISNVLGQAGIDASLMGVDPTAVPIDTTAVRFAIGQLELGRPEYSAVKVKITSQQAIDECYKMYADAFGGDAGGTDGGKDHIWRYFDPTLVTLDPCVFLQKVASKALVAPGETFYYDITFANNGTITLPNITITDTLPSGLVHVSATPAPTTMTSPNFVWNLGTIEPGDLVTIRQYVKATGSGTLFNTATARSGTDVLSIAQASVEVGVRAILDKNKTVTPSAVAPGATVTYTLNIENIGTGLNGVPLRVREFLPPGFTFVSLGSTTLNGAAIATPTIAVDSSNSSQPLFTIGQGIQPGKKLVINFTALVGASVQPGTYWNSFQLEYEGKIVPPIPEAPVTVAGGKIGDTVWYDWNGNGSQDSGEAGVSGVSVNLYEADGTTLLASTITDSNGKYYFNGLVGATYVVKVTPPANTTQTGDPDATVNNQHTVILATDQQYLTADFGYRPSGSGAIGDLVFEDVGNDGVFTPGTDTGIPGVTVQLYADTNGDGVVTPGVDVLIGTITTNGSGIYGFTGLAQGFDYLAVTNPADSVLATYFGVDPYQSSTANTQAIDNLSGSYLNADFGFWKVEPSSIGDQVFIDADGNGLYNPAIDSPLGGVRVNLLRDGSPVATATTAPDGTYLFDNLGPGSYTVAVNTSSMGIPSGYAPSVARFAVSLTAGEDFLTADFPFTPLISKTVNLAYAQPGNTLNFGVNVNYTGSSLLSDAVVRDYLPIGTSFSAASQGGTLQTFASAPGTPGLDAGSAGGATVTLDTASGLEDTWLEENSPDRNYGGAVDLRIDPESGRPEHALLRFTLPNNLPADAMVTSATLKLTKLSGSAIDIIAHQADNSWTEGTLTGTNGVASWNNRVTATPWATAGGDFIENPADPTVSSGTAATGDRNWQVAHIVQNWLDGDPNDGFLLKHPLDDGGNTQNVFASSENTTTASRPTLTFTYTSVARPGTSNTITVVPSVVAVGSPVTVTMTLESTQAVANVVPSALQLTGGAATVSAPSPAILNLAANIPANVTWTVTPSATGEYRFSATASNGTVNFIQASSNSLLVSPNGENQYVVWNLGSNQSGTTGTTATSNNLYSFVGADAPSFNAYNTTTSTWNSPLNPTDTPAGVTIKEGGALTNDGVRYIYALRGDATRVFLRYDTTAGTWDDASIADLPATTDKVVLKGGSLVYLNGYVYATLGNDSLQLWRYDVANNSWLQMTNAPGTVNNGAGLTTDGTNIYTTQGDGKKGFWRYNVTANTWSLLTPFADNCGDGGGLVYANGAIYVLRGAGQATFRRYNIATNIWTTLAVVPGNVDDGGAIAFDGVDIYVLRGKTNVFYKYNIAGNTWSTLATAPATIGWGGSLTYLATGNVSRVSASASPTLVMGTTPQVTVRMSVSSDDAQSNVTSTTPTFTATSGITTTFGSPTLVSPDDDISGSGDPVIYEWIATVTSGTVPGNITFTVGNSLGGSALTNSVLVSPTLTYAAQVGATPPGVIENTAYVSDSSGTITETPSNTTQTATAASIGDYVWVDLDADGIQDAGEYGLGGVTVNLYAADSITLIATQVTDANGAYRIFGLAAGSYVVSYDASSVPPGYLGSTPLAVAATLTSGQQFNTADFGLAPIPAGTGSIGDYVWIDADNDGVQDSGELPLAGVNVILERLVNGLWVVADTTTTDASGAYIFSGLSAADYRVTVVSNSPITSPYAQGTFALGDVMAPTYDRDGTATANVALVTLATNSTVINNADFGYNWSGSIGDFVWWDYDTDGLQDESPLVGIPNARVELYFDADFDGFFDRILGDYEILRVFTDANGAYTIRNLPPGNYYVNVYEDSITTNGVRNVVPTTDDIVPVNLAPSSMNVVTADFGYYVGARVEATVFWDANANTIIENGEQLLPGVTVTLTGTDNSGNPVTRTADTDINGHVVFLVPEGNYTISYNTANIASNYPALGTTTTPVSFDFTAVAGEDGIRKFDFGVDNTGSIGDTIYADIDGNGSQSGSEPGLAGVTVRLYFDANGDGVIDPGAGDLLLETIATDGTGNYRFSGLPDTAGAARYLVRLDTATIPDVYLTVPTGYPAGAVTATSSYGTALVGGAAINIVDFGYPLVPDVYYAISGTIYDDDGVGGGTASNGAQDGTEAGIPNVQLLVEVDTEGNGSYETSYLITTDTNGNYSLGGIPEGANIRITADPSTLPSTAYVQTGDPNGGSLSNVWTITDIQANAVDIDFGYIEDLGSIAGTIVQGDGDGVAEPGEAVQSGVTVTATSSGPDGIPGNGDDLLFTTTTDSNGNYSFTDLPPGAYKITTIIPSGFHDFADADGFNTNSIDVILAIGENAKDRDFEYQKASVSGTVWTDSDADGKLESGEPLLAGVLVFLDLDANGVLDGSEPSTTTDANGFYLFEKLDSDTYVVRIDPTTLPAGLIAIFDFDGIATPHSALVVVNPNQNVTNVDYGYYAPASISGTVRADTTGDGIADILLEGVLLSLLDGSGAPVLDGNGVPVTTTTNSSGVYVFGGLLPGSYQVRETQPAGYGSISDVDGDDPDWIGNVSAIVIASGQNSTGKDFLEFLQACPDQWTAWQQKWNTILVGDTGTGANPDGDRYSNLLEYAFCMPPNSGVRKPFCLVSSQSVSGAVDGVYSRTAGGAKDITYVLEYITALGNTMVWSSKVLDSSNTVVTNNGNGTETVRIIDLEFVTTLTAGSGFVRIRVDLNGTQTATDNTETLGWVETPFGICCSTYNNPFLRCATFTGTVDSVDGQDLVVAISTGPFNLADIMESGVSYYVEVTNGVHEGRRYDVVSASGTRITLANDGDIHAATSPFNTHAGPPPALDGASIAMHRHHTLAGLFPPGGFGATGTQSTADDLQVFADGAWKVYWLYDKAGIPRWVDAADAGDTDMGATVIPPGQGMFFHNRHALTPVLAFGEVRENDFIRPLQAGSNLVGGGYPVHQSANAAGGRDMNTVTGFFGSMDFKTADSVFIWRTDETPGATGYHTYYLLNGGPSLQRWVRVGDASLNVRDAETLLLRDRSVFVRAKNGVSQHKSPAPWIP